MKISLAGVDFYKLVFAVLILMFNWPLLSIPGPENLILWIFAAWSAAIAVLYLASRGARAKLSAENDALPRFAEPGSDGSKQHSAGNDHV